MCLKFQRLVFQFDLCIMALLRSLLMKLEWFGRKYLVFKVAYKFKASRTMFLKAKKSLGEMFCVTSVFPLQNYFNRSACSLDKNKCSH